MPGGTYSGPIDHPGRQPIAMPNVNDVLRSSGLLTADADITTTPAGLVGYKAKGSATDVLEFRDGGASGTILWKHTLSGSAEESVSLPEMLPFNTSLYVNITSSAIEYEVLYK